MVIIEEFLPLYLLIGFVVHMVLASKAAAAKGANTWTFNAIAVFFPLVAWLYLIALPAPDTE